MNRPRRQTSAGRQQAYNGRVPTKTATMVREPKSLENVLAGVQEAPRDAWKFARDTLRAARAVVRGFRGENISLRAAALTYVSLLAIVPLGTVGLTVASAVGQEKLRMSLRDFALAQLAPGAKENTLEMIDTFIKRAGSGILGTLGVVVLVFTALELLWNIERSLNDIWAVPKHRSWAPRLAVYWVVLTLGPVVLAVSVAGTDTIENMIAGAHETVPRWLSTPLHITAATLGLTVLYWVTPNAPVRIRSAFAGGIVSAVAWEIAKHGYAIYASRSFSYGAIYGALAAIPLFFIWIYVSWWITLFGARLAYAVQNAAVAGRGMSIGPRGRELLCTEALIAVCQSFLDASAGPTAPDVAKTIGVSESETRQALALLTRGRLVAEDAGGSFVPARHPRSITLADLSRAALEIPASKPGEAVPSALAAHFHRGDLAGLEALAVVNFEQLSRVNDLATAVPAPAGAFAKP